MTGVGAKGADGSVISPHPKMSCMSPRDTPGSHGHGYYNDKRASLADIFGVDDVELLPNSLRVSGREYPIIEDVIVLGDPADYTPFVERQLGISRGARLHSEPFSEEVQYSFGEEWKSYGDITSDHARTFGKYFDLIDLPSLSGQRACDLGCGSGRWSYFLTEACREIVLVDFL
jgi:hypothetical protein